MTAEQKAARAEERRAARAEALQQERADKRLTAEAMRAVLKHPDSSPEQLIFAVEVLDGLECYRLIPCNSFTRIQADEAAEERRRAFMQEFVRKHPEIAQESEDAKKHA